MTQIRVGYEAADWAETALDLAGEQHPLFVAAVGAAARGAWNRGDFARARALAGRAAGRAPAGVTARTGYPADVAADVALYEGEVDTALAHYTAQVELARRDGNPIRLVWTLYYVAICYAVRREPELGRPAAAGVLRRGGGDSQPDRAVDGPLRARTGAQEVRASQGAGTVRPGRGSGRLGGQLLVGGHRADGGGGHPGRARRRAGSGAGIHCGARALGTGRRPDPAMAQPAVRRPAAGPARSRRRRRRAAPLPGRAREAVPVASRRGPAGWATVRTDRCTRPRPGRAPGSPRPRRSVEPAACCAATAEPPRGRAGTAPAPAPACTPPATPLQLPGPTLGTQAARGRAGTTRRRASCH